MSVEEKQKLSAEAKQLRHPTWAKLYSWKHAVVSMQKLTVTTPPSASPLKSESFQKKIIHLINFFFPNRLSNMRGGADWGVATTSFCILTYTCFHEYHLALVWWYRGRSCCGRTPSSPARLEFLTFFLTPSLGRVKIVWVIFHLFSVKSSWKVIFGTNFFESATELICIFEYF